MNAKNQTDIRPTMYEDCDKGLGLGLGSEEDTEFLQISHQIPYENLPKCPLAFVKTFSIFRGPTFVNPSDRISAG